MVNQGQIGVDCLNCGKKMSAKDVKGHRVYCLFCRDEFEKEVLRDD